MTSGKEESEEGRAEPLPFPGPQDALAPDPVDESDVASVRIEHGDFGFGPGGPLKQLVACEFENGILADMAKKRELCLYTVPNNELAPVFTAGEVVVIDVSQFQGEGEQDCWDLGGPGWYLVGTYGAPRLRHLILSEGKIIAKGAEGDSVSFDTIHVCGAVVARISISAV